jgi:excisionase family DNA binding protein
MCDSTIDCRQLAELLRVRPETIRLWASRGLLPAYRAGEAGPWRFNLSEVRDGCSFVRKEIPGRPSSL